MTRTWLYADPHFGHEGTACRFTRADGSPLRPFASVEEQDKELIYRYLTTVSKDDKVYFLGDVAMNPKHLHVLSNLPGDKVLIKGNHDTAKLSQYTRYFRDIRASWQLAGMLLTHIPVHPDSIGRWHCNIHGHLHYRDVVTDSGEVDPRYLCVSVEHTDYAPILLEDALDRIKQRQRGPHAVHS